jgi:hypothetical protein
MLRYVCALSLFILPASIAASDSTVLPGIIRSPLSVPIALPDGHQVTLEGLVIRPDRPGKFPLVILVHGSPRSEPGKALEAYRRASPTGLAGPALAFAQHGYAAVSIMRRGFGRSDGPYAEFITDPCENTDYLRVGMISAEDVSGAVATLRREPWADPDRVVLLGDGAACIRIDPVHQHEILLRQHHHHMSTGALGAVAGRHDRARKMYAVADHPPHVTIVAGCARM